MEVAQQKSWFRRNWVWFIPSMGCFTLIVLIALGIFGLFSMINDSEPLEHGLELASKNAQVIELLGEPIEKTGIPNGEMTFDSSSGGRMDMIFTLKGPKGKAAMKIKAFQDEEDTWIYELLYVQPSGGEKIDLLE